MRRLIRRLLRLAYGAYVPEPVRNSLSLHLTLLRRDVEPARVPAPADRRVLVLAPHMDDEVFGCGGTLGACAKRGGAVTVAYVTDGSKGYRPATMAGRPPAEVREFEARLVETRKAEAQRAGAALGARRLIFLDLPDAGFAVTPAAVSRLAVVLREVAPEVVFLPFMTDLHRDHWMTNRLFLAAAAEAALPASVACWGYEVWTPLVANTVVDITETFAAKLEASGHFASQTGDFDYGRAITGLNAYRSLLCRRGDGYAEAFFVTGLPLYRRLYDEIVIGRR